MGSLIDSSIFIAAERGVLAPEVARRLVTPDAAFAMSSVTAAELGPASARERSAIPIIDFDLAAARVRARIDAELQAKGITVPRDDLAIACTALSRGFDVATRNQRDFLKVPGLVVVTW